jgi:hypothetical protein
MNETLHRHRREVRAAVATAKLTIKSMAGAMGMTPRALRSHTRGGRPLPASVLGRVAALLRYQSDRLRHRAEKLEALVREAGGDPKLTTGPRIRFKDY